MTLVARLAEYASRDGAGLPLHRERLFDWQLALDEDGRPEPTLRRLVDPESRQRPRGVPHAVPTAVRASGVAPNLAADDAQYVLGWADEDSKAGRVAQCHAAFVDLTRRWAESDKGKDDPVAQALDAFYRRGGHALIERPDGCTAKSGVLISVGGTPAYRAESAPAFWTTEVARRKGSSAGDGLCLVCGQVRPLLDTLPGKVPSRLVPGASNDAALVSVNASVFGYGLITQLAASPICMSCGEAVTAGLARALSSEHSASYGGQDSRMAWWTTRRSAFDFMATLSKADPDDVTAILQASHTGSGPVGNPVVDDPAIRAMFCSVTVGGNIARVVVRDWIEMPVEKLVDHVGQWFRDQEIVPLRPGGRSHHGIGLFTAVCGRWAKDRYAPFDAKNADRPDGVHRDLTRAAQRGTPLPLSLLAHLVKRIRTDSHLDDPRAALLRLILTRSPGTTEKPMAKLDPDNSDPAYVAGRAFAVLAQIQYDVTQGRLNTTFADRYFAGAISNPRAAIVGGSRDAHAWLRKLRRDPTKQAAVTRHEKELDQLFGLIGPESSLPGRTTLEQQALFLLGYHHQRAHHFAAIAAAKAQRAGAASDSSDVENVTEETSE